MIVRRLFVTMTLILSMLISSVVPSIAARQASVAATPESAAVFYSQLEAGGSFSDLYRWMHPDAQRIVPEAAVVGWYTNKFAPNGPGVITVTGIQYTSWTWEVTGQTYPTTAVVSFTQPFANGTVIEDVIRLVDVNGEWRWFFGRSREFVNEQIALYASQPRTTTTTATSRTSGSGGVVTVTQLQSMPIPNAELPPRMTAGTVTESLVGTGDGPLFGLLGDDLGATWLNVEVSVEPDPYSFGGTTVYMQYAVFPTEAAAQQAYLDSAIHDRIGRGYLGDHVTVVQPNAIFTVEALLWGKPPINTATETRLGRESTIAGTVARAANVLVFTYVSVNVPQILPGAPTLDPSTAVSPAYNLTEAAVHHIEGLAE